MALFTDTRELERQGRRRNMRKVTGDKKLALSLLGYKDDGTRNMWGKVNPFVGGGFTGEIAGAVAKGTDTGEVLEAGRGEAWSSTLNKAALAANIATLGGSSAGLGALSKGLNMAAGSGASGDLEGIVGDVSTMAKNKKAMDKLNGEPSPDEAVEIGADAPVESIEDGAIVAGDEASGIANKGKGVLNAAGIGDVAQSGLGLITSEIALDSALKEKRGEFDRMSTKQTFNYL